MLVSAESHREGVRKVLLLIKSYETQKITRMRFDIDLTYQREVDMNEGSRL